MNSKTHSNEYAFIPHSTSDSACHAEYKKFILTGKLSTKIIVLISNLLHWMFSEQNYIYLLKSES